MTQTRYRQIYHLLKVGIHQGDYPIGSNLPSENELCRKFSITRTTARRALEELVKDGFIDRSRGRRSQVKERMHSLGLLAIQGFSEAACEGVKTEILTPPVLSQWPEDILFEISEAELAEPSIYFRRLRKIRDQPVMYESNWFSSVGFEDFPDQDFVEGSFFKTLSQRYLIEITGSCQELYAIKAEPEIAEQLEIGVGEPVLRICVKFTTSKPFLNIFARLYCNTEAYPIGNAYTL